MARSNNSNIFIISNNSFGSEYVQQSPTFPEDYGELILESIDRMRFNFPRPVFAHASLAFKRDAPMDTHKFQLREDAVTLDLILRHIDPKHQSPPLDIRTIDRLLEAARKYELPSIYEWFCKEVALSKIIETSRPSHLQIPSLLWRNPSFVLALSVKFGLADLAQMAARNRIKQGPLTDADDVLQIDLYRTIHQEKEKRIQTFMTSIRKISSHVPGYWQEPDAVNGYRTFIPVERVRQCRTCMRTRIDWVLEMTRVVHQTPDWAAFYSILHAPGCSVWCQSRQWAAEVSDIAATLKREINEMDLEEIPI